ncbi:hypothetical protein BLA29_012130, partial [Euroglyphus maynei]
KLNLLESPAEKINSLNFSRENQLDHQKVVGAVKSLQALGELIQADQVESKRFELTKHGDIVVENGSYEFRFWSAIPMDGSILQSDLMKSIPDPIVTKVGFPKAMTNKWITLDKSSGKPMIKRNVSNVKDEIPVLLKLVKSGAATKVCC